MTSVPLDDDPWVRRWARRAITLPLVLIGATVVWSLLPLWLLLAAARDLLGARPRWPTVRALAFLAWYLACELAGLTGAVLSWLLTAGGLASEALLRISYTMQRLWSSALFAGMQRIWDVKLQVEGVDALPPGSRFVLFLRHASLPDVLLPAAAFANPRRIVLRYVLKVEVCAIPTLDVVGHRLPNAFVRRGSGDPGREIARILKLHEGMGPDEGLVIYPEGTRFSAGKRQRLLDKFEGPARDRVASFTHVLPPRSGGPLALLGARARGEDVVFCAHVGTEVAVDAQALLDGALTGRTVRVVIWHVPGSEVPRDPERARAWLDEWWHRVDDWVEAHQEPADDM